jgi:hypothetical protein
MVLDQIKSKNVLTGRSRAIWSPSDALDADDVHVDDVVVVQHHPVVPHQERHRPG